VIIKKSREKHAEIFSFSLKFSELGSRNCTPKSKHPLEKVVSIKEEIKIHHLEFFQKNRKTPFIPLNLKLSTYIPKVTALSRQKRKRLIRIQFL
jgi:hypothetical protein